MNNMNKEHLELLDEREIKEQAQEHLRELIDRTKSTYQEYRDLGYIEDDFFLELFHDMMGFEKNINRMVTNWDGSFNTIKGKTLLYIQTYKKMFS